MNCPKRNANLSFDSLAHRFGCRLSGGASNPVSYNRFVTPSPTEQPAVEPYDSPTFLGNKDKLLLGMTIGQIGVFMGSGLLWLMIALAAEFSTLKSLLIFGPAHTLTVAFFMVKLSGLALPMYLLAMLSSLVSSAGLSCGRGRGARGSSRLVRCHSAG